jgi:hypothetical protein
VSRSQAQSETAIANDQAAILKLATASKNDSGALSSIAIQQKFKEGVTTRVTRNATPTCVDFTFGLDPEEIISRYPLGSFCQNCEWFVQDSQLCQNKSQVKRNSKRYNKCTANQKSFVFPTRHIPHNVLLADRKKHGKEGPMTEQVSRENRKRNEDEENPDKEEEEKDTSDEKVAFFNL